MEIATDAAETLRISNKTMSKQNIYQKTKAFVRFVETVVTLCFETFSIRLNEH